jgi:hypothetical protein
MDVDGEPSVKGSKKKGTKRKAADDGAKPAKKQKRADSDPWKLESKPVQKDWTQMKAPPLEMFHFARKVVDEYTYLDGKVHSLITKVTADRLWVLSGTPPIHDFAALKTISAFLDLHLGVDDDGEGQSAEVKKRRRDQTGEYLSLLPSAFPECDCSQVPKSSIPSERFTPWNGTLVDMSLGKSFWIHSCARSV